MSRFANVLSNLVSVTLAATLLWVNLRPTVLETKAAGQFISCGWPLSTWWFWVFHGGRWHPYEDPWVFLAMGVNVLVAVAILCIARYVVNRFVQIAR